MSDGNWGVRSRNEAKSAEQPCLSRRCSWGTLENLAAHRCSNLLSRSRGIMLITKSSGSAVAPGLEGLNARGPLKVHPKWRPEESALASRAVAPIDRHQWQPANPTRTTGLPRLVQKPSR